MSGDDLGWPIAECADTLGSSRFPQVDALEPLAHADHAVLGVRNRGRQELAEI